MVCVSIVVPIYNCEKDLEHCIESIRNQSYEKLQIILVDDGSTDASGILCDQLVGKDRRIEVIHNTNHGVSYSRNCGIRRANGKYIMFVDSDDCLLPGAIEETVALAEKQELDSVVYGFCYKNMTKGTSRDNYPTIDFVGNTAELTKVYMADLLKRELFNPPWNKLIRLALLKENGIFFNEKFSICEDMAFSMLVLAYSKKVAVMNKVYYDYCIKESGSLVFKYYDNYFEALSYYYACALKCYEKTGEPECMLREVQRIFLNKSYLYVLRICREMNISEDAKKQKMYSMANDKNLCSFISGLPGNRSKKIVFWSIKKKLICVAKMIAWCKRKQL